MSNTLKVLLCLAVLLTGCKTGSRRGEKQSPPDWGTPPQPMPEPAPQTNAPPPATEPETTWMSLDRWCARHGLESPRRLTSSPVLTYSLATRNGLFVLQVGGLQAYWAGLQFWLGFTPQVIDGQIFLHSLDLRKNLEPLLNGRSGGNSTNCVIVIDPGHGGGNTGAQSAADGHFEKEFTLDWARRLAPLLEQRGWRVFLTRTNDVEVPLGDRVVFAEQHRADLFLSLHFNASPAGRQQAGIETFSLTPVGMPSSLKREFEDDSTLVFPNNAFDVQNLQYAARLHRALVGVNGNSDRGLRRARFMGVLRGQNRPAVLLEGGYLSNPAEARRIADPEFRQRLAEAVARALE